MAVCPFNPFNRDLVLFVFGLKAASKLLSVPNIGAKIKSGKFLSRNKIIVGRTEKEFKTE